MWVVIFTDVRAFLCAAWGRRRGKSFFGHLFLVRSVAARKTSFFLAVGHSPYEKRGHTQLLLCKHNASMDHFFLVRSCGSSKNFVFPRCRAFAL